MKALDVVLASTWQSHIRSLAIGIVSSRITTWGPFTNVVYL